MRNSDEHRYEYFGTPEGEVMIIEGGTARTYVQEDLDFTTYMLEEVDSHTVRQILKISQSTLNRYVDNNLLKVTNKGEGDRKFNLAEILYLNKEEMKRQNRTINRTQIKIKSKSNQRTWKQQH